MDWDNLYSSFKSFANRAAVKINQTADIATLQVRVSMAEKKLEEAYCALGHVSYEHFTGDEDLSERVAKAVSGVNDATIALRSVQAELAEAKKRAEEPVSDDVHREAQERSYASAPEAKEEPDVSDAEAPVAPVAPDVPATPVSSYSDAEDTVDITVEETL